MKKLSIARVRVRAGFTRERLGKKTRMGESEFEHEL